MIASSGSQPEDFARALIERFAVSEIVDLSDLAGKIGLEIEEVESEGFEGALVRLPNKPIGIIAVKKNIREPGRKRFTIAHELGHYILPGHGTVDCICKSENIESYRTGIPDHEIAANRFSSELLLPFAAVGPIVIKSAVSIATAKLMSNRFLTSLTAAALRCVELTKEATTLVVSKNNVIEWYKPSNQFRYYVRRGEQISRASLASQLSNEQREKSGSVPADAWISSFKLREGATAWEDSVFLPYYNTILTFVVPSDDMESAYDEEGETLAELDPQDFTLSRRRWPGRR